MATARIGSCLADFPGPECAAYLAGTGYGQPYRKMLFSALCRNCRDREGPDSSNASAALPADAKSRTANQPAWPPTQATDYRLRRPSTCAWKPCCPLEDSIQDCAHPMVGLNFARSAPMRGFWRSLDSKAWIKLQTRLDPRRLVFLDEMSASTKDRKSTRLNSSHLGISYAV